MALAPVTINGSSTVTVQSMFAAIATPLGVTRSTFSNEMSCSPPESTSEAVAVLVASWFRWAAARKSTFLMGLVPSRSAATYWSSSASMSAIAAVYESGRSPRKS